MPKCFDRYVEPFVGGGAVYFALDIPNSIINDKSDELINLYRFIQCGNVEFILKLKELYNNWILLEKVVEDNSRELLTLYKDYCDSLNDKYIERIYDLLIKHSSDFKSILNGEFDLELDNFIYEVKRNLLSKISRMCKISNIKGGLSDNDILENIEASLKSAYYMHFRFLYNYKEDKGISPEFSSAIFYFIREYCFSSMFRYNSQGKFNVPYGGISYNRKDFSKKISYIESNSIRNYMANTKIYNLDFEEFCDSIDLNENDFMFLDPPYDTEFSTYAKNDFDKNDQIRLANFLKNIKAKFMLVIKNTDFIYSLYNVDGFFIKSFDKRYLVSFQNRNNKDAEHLIITNYEI